MKAMYSLSIGYKTLRDANQPLFDMGPQKTVLASWEDFDKLTHKYGLVRISALAPT
jgi:hypothetical protein